MSDNHSGSADKVSTKYLLAACFITLSGLVILPDAGRSQATLTTKQAEQRAETLLGRKLDHVVMYFSQKENLEYFAFTALTESKWDEATKTQTRPREEIWIYERARGSDDMRPVWEEHRLWPDMDRYDPPAGFIEVPGQTPPCLRLSAYTGGMHAGTNRLGLYCIAEHQLFWVDFFSDFGPSSQTGVQKVQVIEENAAQPQIRRSLLSWGHDLALDVPPKDPRIDAVRRLQQLWIDTNGRKACSYEQTTQFRWRAWKTDQIDKLTPYRTRTLLKDPLVVLDDGRYQWLSYPGADAMANVGSALAGVGRYDKQLGRYDLVYVPDSSFDYSKALVVIGDWLYIQDCGQWAVRFNKVTHHLECGDFDEMVGDLSTGVYPTSRSNSPAMAGAFPSTTPRSTAHEPAQQQIFIPPGIDPSARDLETIRRNLARITLANPSLFDRLNPLARAVTICKAAGLDQTDEDACLYRAVIDEQKRQEAFKQDNKDFKKRFLNVPHPSVGELRKMAHACNVVMWERGGHRSKTINVPEGTEVLITWVSGTGNSEGKIASGNYVGRQILFMDSDLAPKSVGHK